MRRVLLTGAKGFVGSHILQQRLDQGYSGRAVVRSQSKAGCVRLDHPNAGSRLDVVIVPDITAPEAFDRTLDSTPPVIDTVIHTAAPYLYGAANTSRTLWIQTFRVLLNCRGQTIIVVTISCAVVIDFNPMAGGSARTFTSADWNPVTWEEAVTTNDHSGAYCASRRFAELAAWDFVKPQEPPFDLVVLCPPMVYGPLWHTINSIEELNEDAPLPPNGVHVYVDVGDPAHAHILAATNNAVSNERIIVSGEKLGSQAIADILRGFFPPLVEQYPVGPPGASSLSPSGYDMDTTVATDILGLGTRSVEETPVDLASQLLRIGGFRN
ncbi:NAD(P)-binding protein [Aspergillus fijiensis CBS 313.89]|uniref:NAD(P)-binding protein n=1 Tax=Aspergillus fijiensis CBS 313.89 TaxID=1448319 RepID=A0A8G1RV82_9EURO|nr:NAD(P)-binding protein [Aspergillus fijiensis CBS 313.89]RAK79332.1 NAD(P)-binding protein [Aspergillus fijiensis CBS 313.89]